MLNADGWPCQNFIAVHVTAHTWPAAEAPPRAKRGSPVSRPHLPRRLCVKHVKSNAITVAKDGKLLGMGSGQPNRVKSVQIALEKAGEEVKVRCMPCMRRAQEMAARPPASPHQGCSLACSAWGAAGCPDAPSRAGFPPCSANPRPTTHISEALDRTPALPPTPPRPAQGSVLASDAFFPFSWNDSVEIACQAGVGAIVHPGGSVRDQDAIDCCNKYGVVLLTTGVRHFKCAACWVWEGRALLGLGDFHGESDLMLMWQACRALWLLECASVRSAPADDQ